MYNDNDDIRDEDIPIIIEYLEEKGENVEEFMQSSYRELVFLGTSPKKIGGKLLEAAIFNLKLCLHYYLMKEEYLTVSELKSIYDSLLDTTIKIDIDENILKSISINPN